MSTDFTFKGWDTEFTTVFGNQTVTALYTESVRKYTVRYLNRGAVLKSVTAPYGSTVLYDGDMPVYTGEETAYKYYLLQPLLPERWYGQAQLFEPAGGKDAG